VTFKENLIKIPELSALNPKLELEFGFSALHLLQTKQFCGISDEAILEAI